MKYLASLALLAAVVLADDNAPSSTASVNPCISTGPCADAINLQMASCKDENISENSLKIGECTCKLDANYWQTLSDCIQNCPEFSTGAPKNDPNSLQQYVCNAIAPYSSELNASTDGSQSTADAKDVTTTSGQTTDAGSKTASSETTSATTKATTATTSSKTGSATSAAETETSSTKNAAAALGFGSLVYIVAAAII
ncbi:hypothetical protein JA1_004282 [Spathaspora sp. JA1]|nr:hypothetical protein JA1_004282 [Spathaspora sp. JA1]